MQSSIILVQKKRRNLRDSSAVHIKHEYFTEKGTAIIEIPSDMDLFAVAETA